ncbi:Protein dachsous, variant 2 [Clonorchis sinensis]|uniref:Protein dachsous, variant 2 n=2 Tax=Clonorchis sinensis TaxID=79923 RepID=A0A8T1MAV1_CLOSI|nr:Protein dachsous, variant 2 [Clonorchis sinensis]
MKTVFPLHKKPPRKTCLEGSILVIYPVVMIRRWLTCASSEVYRFLARFNQPVSNSNLGESRCAYSLTSTSDQHNLQTSEFRMLALITLLIFASQTQSIQASTIRLRDNTPEGTLIPGRILPGVMGNQLTYSLLQSKGSNYFTVDNRTGQLSSVRLIDRDLLCAEAELCCVNTHSTLTYSSAIDFSHPGRSSDHAPQHTCTFNLSVSVVSSPGQQPDIHDVTVIIIEENDHIPVFKLPGTTRNPGGYMDPLGHMINISESAPVGHRVRLPLAEDIDAPPFQVQTYELHQSDSPTGPLSHRTEGNPFKLKIIRDLGEKSDPYDAERLTSSPIVGLELELTQPLDRENVAQYSYRILAIDGGNPPCTGALLLQVRILDTNDHAPKFAQNVYEVTVNEGVVGKEIVQLLATDADEGPNGVIRYDWLDAANWEAAIGTKNQTAEHLGNNAIVNPLSGQLDPSVTHPSYWFRLNVDTGSIYLYRPLDYEQRSQYRFQIIAYNPIARHVNLGDVGFRTMTATATVIVHVRNLDDEAPRIVIDYATGGRNDYKEIQENKPAPYFVAFITVDDPDLVDASLSASYVGGTTRDFIDSSAVTCQLDPPQEFYRLERDKRNTKASTVRYSLSTQAPLDRERSAEDHIRIVCQDSGSPVKTATAVATVKILDENDCTPVLQVFSTFPTHGSSATPVESWPMQRLRNLVKELPDASQLEAAYMSSVPVHTVRVSENQPTGTIFARIRPIDNDSGENARVTFDLPKMNELVSVSNEYSQSTGQLSGYQSEQHGKIEFPVSREALDYFQIDEIRGDLSTRKRIDREEGFSIFEQIFLLVKGTDHGTPVQRSALVLLDIRIVDDNDNPPTFLEPKMRFDIQERIPAPAIVGEIRVVDPDIEPLSAAVDEALQGQHLNSLNRLAYWNDAQNTSRSRLQLRIDPGHGRRDLPFILYRNSQGRFYLNTTRELDRETDEAFQFTIIATDADASPILGGSSSKVGHTATASVSVNVLDTNDNFPEIIFPNPSTSNSTVHRVSYREYVGYEIISINANDRDAGEQNGKFHFELVPDSKSVELFTINRNTGLLQTRRVLTKEDLGEHVLQVIVRDEGSPPLETRLTLRLVVDQSEPHRPGDARHLSNSNLNAHDYEQRNQWGARTYRDSAISMEPTTRPFHTEILLSVIVAMILILLLITFGLCLYLRRKHSSFSVVQGICGNICASTSPTDSAAVNRSMEQKSIYMKNELDLKKCCVPGQHHQSNGDQARQRSHCHPDSYKELTEKLLPGQEFHKSDLLRPSFSHSPVHHQQHGKMPRQQYPISPQPARDHFHSSMNLANPYCGFTMKDAPGGDVRPVLPLSPTLIGSEDLFQPIVSHYRPGMAMAVNIPDVAGQAESQRAQYMGYCQTGQPTMAFSPPVNKTINGVLFAPANGRTNAYNVGGMYEARHIVPDYVNDQSEMTNLHGTFPNMPASDFRSIQDDSHVYQYIYPEKASRSGHQTGAVRRVYGTANGMKPSATFDQRKSRKQQLYQPEHEEAVVCSSPLNAWRSDPSLNQALDGRGSVGHDLADSVTSGSKSFRRYNRSKATDEQFSQSVKYTGRSGQGPRKTDKYSTFNRSDKISPSSSPLSRVENCAPMTKQELIRLVGQSPTSQRIGESYAVSFPKVQASFV